MRKKPTHIIYHVIKKNDSGDESLWKPIGAAWAHKDGKGFTPRYDYWPTEPNPHIVVRAMGEPEQNSTDLV
jgi:hypothetical protein